MPRMTHSMGIGRMQPLVRKAFSTAPVEKSVSSADGDAMKERHPELFGDTLVSFMVF